MLEHEPIKDAQVAIGDAVGELPRESTIAPPSAPGAPPTIGTPDADGLAFDPARHEAKPGPTGRWRGKRGNGARKVRGESVATPAGPSRVVVVESIRDETGAPGAPVVPGEPVNPDYDPIRGEASGQSFSRALGGLLRVCFGAAWDNDPAEREAFGKAWGRLWVQWELPLFGGIAELLGLSATAVAKRSDDPVTQTRFGRVMTWCGLRRPSSDPVPLESTSKNA